MLDIQKEMHQVVVGFVSVVTALAHREAADIVNAAFGGNGMRAMRRGRPPGVQAPKRSAEDLEALAIHFLGFVHGKPGLRIEQINRELGTTTRDLALPIRRLIAQGTLVTIGEKRATTYFPGKKAGQS